MRLVLVLILAVTCIIWTPIPSRVLADDGGPHQSAAGPNAEQANETSVQLNPSFGNDANPLSLLYPIKDFLSSQSWMLASAYDPRTNTDIHARIRESSNTSPKVAWESTSISDSLREIFTAPVSPPAKPSMQTGAGLVPFRDPAPSFSRNILITRDFSNNPFQAEPHIAVNPKDPDHLIMASIDYNFPNVSNYVSIDGGATWEGPYQPQFLRDDLGSGGDPILTFDRHGTAYLAFISLGVEEYTVGMQGVGEALISSIAVTRSSDGGRTWTEAISAARSDITKSLQPLTPGRVQGSISVGFLDKPWLTTGTDPTNPNADILYVTYTEFIEEFQVFYVGDMPFFGAPIITTVIKVVKSEDLGISWSNPQTVSPTVRRIFGERSGAQPSESNLSSTILQEGTDLIEGTTRVVQGSQPAVTDSGTLHVVWLDSTDDDSMEGLAEIYIATSTDKGASFSKPRRIVAFLEPGFRPRTNFFRYWGAAFPQIATGPNKEVYVVYTGLHPTDKTDDGDIYLARSLNDGIDWEDTTRINSDDTSRLQFFPSIDTDKSGGVHLMWADMRDDPSQSSYHIYYTSSVDKGRSWGFTDNERGIQTRNTRVSDFPSNPNKGFPNGRFIGDYFSIAATDNDVYLVWTDSRLGEFGPPNQKIGFTRRTPIQSPEVFLSPPAGPGGQPITLQGFNYQPDINVFIRVGGIVVTTERTNVEGRFSSQIFVPISGEGSHSIDVFDESGNFATSTFFMEFGFDNIQDILEQLRTQLFSIGFPNPTPAGSPNISGDPTLTREDPVATTTLGGNVTSGIEGDNPRAAWWLVFLLAGIAILSVLTSSLLLVDRRRSRAKAERWGSLK